MDAIEEDPAKRGHPFFLHGPVGTYPSPGEEQELGGFASKMGLATGPAVAAILLGEDNYSLIINVAVVALVVSLLAIILPARVQDRH